MLSWLTSRCKYLGQVMSWWWNFSAKGQVQFLQQDPLNMSMQPVKQHYRSFIKLTKCTIQVQQDEMWHFICYNLSYRNWHQLVLRYCIGNSIQLYIDWWKSKSVYMYDFTLEQDKNLKKKHWINEKNIFVII